MKSILFLRGNSLENFIGTTDIEVAFCLKEEYNVSILSKNNKLKSEIRLVDGVSIFEANYLNIPFVGALLFNLIAFMKLKKNQFDIVIVNPGLIFTAYLYKMMNKKSTIVLDIRSIPVDSTNFRLSINEMMLKYSLNSNIISGITIITEMMRDHLKKNGMLNYQLPVACWGSGVNKSIFDADGKKLIQDCHMADDPTTILYHGTLSRSRGIEELIISVNLLIADGVDNIKLLLVGGGKDMDYLQNIVVKLGIEEHVQFTGIIPYDQVPGMMSTADLEIIPFPDMEWWNYQSPMKIFECLAMGMPIITTDIPAHRNISDSILLIPDNNPTTIKDAIKDFIKLDSKKHSELIETAIKDSSKYTWESQAQILSDFLENKIFR